MATPPGSDVEEEVPSATFPYTTFLYNNVAKPNNFSVQFTCDRVRDESGARIWEATLFVDGNLMAKGHGVRKGHAKNEASKEYLSDHGYHM